MKKFAPKSSPPISCCQRGTTSARSARARSAGAAQVTTGCSSSHGICWRTEKCGCSFSTMKTARPPTAILPRSLGFVSAKTVWLSPVCRWPTRRFLFCLHPGDAEKFARAGPSEHSGATDHDAAELLGNALHLGIHGEIAGLHLLGTRLQLRSVGR